MEMLFEEETCAVSKETIDSLKNILSDMLNSGTTIQYCVGCIYGLFQEYYLSEDQEIELYMFVDPEEKYNDCSEYWEEVTDNPLIDSLS